MSAFGERLPVGSVPITANRYSYFFQRRRNLEQWSVCSSILLTSLPWSRPAMERALQWLLVHHDGLRLRLERGQQGWRQWIAPLEQAHPLIVQPTAHDLGSTELRQEVASRLQSLRDGFRFPGDLFHVLVLELTNGRAVIALAAHHVAVDALAFAVAQEDLFCAYEHFATGDGALPNAPAVSYSDFARVSIDHWLEKRERVVSHWRGLRWDLVRPLPESAVKDRIEALEERHSDEVEVVLAPWDEERAGSIVPRQQVVTRALTAIARAYSRWTGHRALHLAMVFRGREPFGGRDLTRTVGWLSCTAPIVLDTECHGVDLWREASRQLRMSQAFGSSYDTLRYLSGDDAVGPELAAHPNPSLSLNVVLPTPGRRSRNKFATVVPNIGAGMATPPDTLRVFPMSGGLVVRNGNLVLCWDFSCRLIERDQGQRFADLCREEYDRPMPLDAATMTGVTRLEGRIV